MQVRSEGTNGRSAGHPPAPPPTAGWRPAPGGNAALPSLTASCGAICWRHCLQQRGGRAGGHPRGGRGGDGRTDTRGGGRHGSRRFNVTLPGRLLRVQRSPPAAPVPPAHRVPPSGCQAAPAACARREGPWVRGSRRCLQGGPRRRPRLAADSPKCPQRGSESTGTPRWRPSDAVLEDISKGSRSLGLG